MTVDTDALRQLVISELERAGFVLDETGNLSLKCEREPGNDTIRELHAPACRFELERRQDWLRRNLPFYLPCFANGDEVEPENIEPELIEVQEKWQHELFRIARLTWSLPYSKGFGRRLRFLLMDRHNGKLIGILALQSPPLSFPARDQLFDYPKGRKTELVNQTMDIHTLGALPPDSRLLAGKLVAMIATSNQV